MIKKITLSILAGCTLATSAIAGNPDRQGEAGAYELLINPWARSAGLNMMNTSTVRGAEALHQNVAGLSRLSGKTEFGLSHSVYLQGTGLSLNTLGFAQRMGKNGALGISINSMSFGKIPVTTSAVPEGTGATFSPNFFNLAASYSHYFDKKVSVGVTFRFINQTLAEVSASGFAIDAGVQYATGSETYPERFKFGISLRNVGTKMRFGGQGLDIKTTDDGKRTLSLENKAAGFELPSQLNIGLAYDILPTDKNKLTAVANFTSNAFSRDDVGAAVEYTFNNLVTLRGGYKYELGGTATANSVYTGISAGASLAVPINKLEDRYVYLDYGYLHSRVWNGTHNISVRLSL